MALIIVGHPQLETSVANKSIIDELQNSDLALEFRHVQALYPNYKIDVRAEQDALLRHDTIVFQYPLYWYNMPAILKQWFDEVFSYQFAYGSQGDKLKGKHFVASFTVGASETGYRAVGEHHFRVSEFCKNLEQTAYYSQMNYVDPLYFHGSSATAGFSAEVVRTKARAHAQRLIRQLTELN